MTTDTTNTGTVTKTDGADRPSLSKKLGATDGRSSEGGVLHVFSHGMLVLWAFMVVMPLLWAVMTSFKDDNAIFSSPWALPDELPDRSSFVLD